MGLGAYSVVRFSDDVSDQRINLGVLVWHPSDGFLYRLTSSVDRVQAINPRATIRPLKNQLDLIRESLTSSPVSNRSLLDDLCRNFRHGLSVSAPYPARIHSASELLERLYRLLVSPVPEIRRASSQKQFESSLRKTIEAVVKSSWPRAKIQSVGTRKIEGIPVEGGIRTQVSSTRFALWHPLSLQAEARGEAQLANAKAKVLDILKLRQLETYRRDKQYVAIRAPRARSAGRFEDVVGCLKSVADEVFVPNDDVALVRDVERGLRALSNGAAHHA